MNSQSHYTFGDGDVAQDRLRLLAEVFEPSSRALLTRVARRRGPDLHANDVVVDLGCGAGYTTELLGEVCGGASRVYAIDRSPLLLEAARKRLGERAEVVEHDVTVAPLPLPPSGLLYARFLLTHLRDVTGVLVGWKRALGPAGRVVLEETASMTSGHPALRRYYALVERMQAHYGQALYIGRSLETAASLAGLRREESCVTDLALPASQMARLHALNLRTWKDDPFVRAAFDRDELEGLLVALDDIASGHEKAPPVACGIRQLILAPAGTA
ncbi:MAG: class I SAM-dependent methyltransferase [Polyangiaceae bacterium]